MQQTPAVPSRTRIAARSGDQAGGTTSRHRLLAVGADVVAVLVFVTIGRNSHAEAESVTGVATTAWPFLAALAAGWLVARAWRAPMRLTTGWVVWAVTVAAGHGLRLMSGQGSAWSFLAVTAVVLGVFLVGWRALARASGRRLRRGR